MNGIKARLARYTTSIGLFLAACGLISSVITFLGYELRLLMWIDRWGVVMSWVIRAGLVVAGLAVAFIGTLFDPENDAEEIERRANEREQRWNMLRHNPRVQVAAADIAGQMPISFEPPADPNTYQVKQIVFQDAQWRWANPSTQQNYSADDPQVTNLVFYLERQGQHPQRLTVGHQLQNRQLTTQEPHPSTWSMMVGG